MLKLCKGCVEALKIYNPYIDENGHQIPIEKLDIKIVPKARCDNFKIGKTKEIKNSKNLNLDINKEIGRIFMSINKQKDNFLVSEIVNDIKKHPNEYPFEKYDEIYFLDRERISDLLRKGLKFEEQADRK